MAKYRKKPVVIEAEQFDGTVEKADELRRWIEGNGGEAMVQKLDVCVTLYIKTLEGTMSANAGDWIIRGLKGEFYPCKPAIFVASYDPEV